jgi:Leucine-rich repeat (LRR) protein
MLIINNVEAGTYTVSVIGRNTYSQAILSGSNSFSISPGGSASISIALQPLEGSGSMRFTLSWDPLLIPDPVLVGTIKAIGAEAQTLSLPAAVNGVLSYPPTSYPAGSYVVGVEIQSNNKVFAQVVLAAVVYDSQESFEDYVLDSNEIAKPPAAPTGLTATVLSDSHVRLAWTDNSLVEEYSNVSWRDDGDVEWTELPDILAPNTTSFDAPAPASGILRYFRVKAVNSFGSSAWSSTASVYGRMLLDLDWFPDPNLRAVVEQTATANSWSYADQVVFLYARSNGIGIISGLERLTSLGILDLYNNEINDISPLAGLVSIKELYLDVNPLGDTSALASLINVEEYLGLDDTGIDDISFVSFMPKLKLLSIGSNHISDLSPLAGLTELTGLGAYQNNIYDLSPLTGLDGMSLLAVGGNPITDLSPIFNLHNLQGLNLSQLGITDITFVSNLRELAYFMAEGNAIVDLSPLAELTELIEIYLAGNLISDLGPLANLHNLTNLHISNNHITDLQPIETCISITYLDLSMNPIIDVAPLRYLTSLQAINIQDCTISTGVSELNTLTALQWAEFQGEGNRNIPLADRSILEAALPGCTFTWPPAPSDYFIGAAGPAGGIVFYENPNHAEDGWRWMEAWTADEPGPYYQWKTSNTSTLGTSTAIGSGYANTYAAMAGTDHPAVEVCRSTGNGGYADWFLPSKDELYLMYMARNSIGVFETGMYWSSSESSEVGAWGFNFDEGIHGDIGKDSHWRIRAVRHFRKSASSVFPVLYHPNTADSGTVPIDGYFYEPGEPLTIRTNSGNLSRSGYEFAGWNTQPDGNGSNYSPGTSYAMPNSNLVLYAQFLPQGEWTTILFDDFEDGDYTNDVTWQSESLDSYYISVEDVGGNMMLRVPRGSDYGWATTAVAVGNQDFRVSWDFQRFGDSLGRPWVTLYDDSGKEAFQAYANSYNGGLTIYAYRYDIDGNPLQSDIIAQEPYSDATGVHHFAFVRAGNRYEFHIDGELGAYGTYDSITSWNDNLVKLGLFGHGSGPDSGAYYDNVKVEVKPSGISAGEGDLSVTITAIMPDDQIVDFTGATPALAFGTSMTVIATTDAAPDAAFQWWLDGSPIPDATSNTVTVGAGLMPGSHSLVLFFRIEGTWYSETVHFEVLAGG